MRKASMILGIVGGSFAIVAGLLMILSGVMTATVFPDFIDSVVDEEAVMEMAEDYDQGAQMLSYNSQMKSFGRKYIEQGILAIIAGISGIVGGAQVKKNNVTGSILMFIGCLFCALSWFRIVAFIIMLLGGIFGLVKDYSKPQEFDDIDDIQVHRETVVSHSGTLD